MKKLVFSLVLAFIAASSFAGEKPQTIKIKTSAICEMCKERIERQLAYTKGVKESNLNLDDKVVTVSYFAKKVDAAKIKKAITEVGYDADEVVAEVKGYEKLPSCCKKDAAPHSDAGQKHH